MQKVQRISRTLLLTMLNAKNCNTRWQDLPIQRLTLDQIKEYDTFIDMGHYTKVAPPVGYNKIRLHLIFDVKHDGRPKARLVADGHLTEVPLDSIYSGVVSCEHQRISLSTLPI